MLHILYCYHHGPESYYLKVTIVGTNFSECSNISAKNSTH